MKLAEAIGSAHRRRHIGGAYGKGFVVVPLLVFGLPTHILVVHAVVVFVPLAALGVVVIAVWPRARRRFGWLVLAVTAVAAVSVPIATSTGEALEHALPSTAALEAHTRLGDELLPFAIPFLVLTAALVLLDRHVHNSRGRAGRLPTIDAASAPGTVTARPPSLSMLRWATVVVAALATVFAVVCTVQVVRIGDSGARAAWGDKTYIEQAPGHRDG